MPKKVFITFGNERFVNSVARIVKEAENTGLFDVVIGYHESDLINDPIFWGRNGEYIQNNMRGYGYYLWKPYLILKTLNSLNDDDILVYADAGSTVNADGNQRMLEYFEIVSNSKYGLLSFQMSHLPERDWTKLDTILYLNTPVKDYLSGQISFTTSIMRNCEHVKRIFQEIYETGCADNYHYIDNTPSNSQNDNYFKEHRNDQSIYSLLVKRYGTEILEDETWSYPNWDRTKPLWATRIRC